MLAYHGPFLMRALIKERLAASNPGLVNVGPGPITIVSSDSFDLISGEWVRIAVDVRMTKGAGPGLSQLAMTQDGTSSAVLESKGEALLTRFLYASDYVVGGARWSAVFDEWFLVTGTGLFVCNLWGTSAGTNSSVAIGDGRIEVIQFR